MKKTLSILLAVLMLSTLLVPAIMANGEEVKGPTPASKKFIDSLVVTYPLGVNIPTYYDYISREWNGRLYLKSVVHKDSEVIATYYGWVYYIMDTNRSVEVKVEGDRGVIVVHDNPLAPKVHSQKLFIDLTK